MNKKSRGNNGRSIVHSKYRGFRSQVIFLSASKVVRGRHCSRSHVQCTSLIGFVWRDGRGSQHHAWDLLPQKATFSLLLRTRHSLNRSGLLHQGGIQLHRNARCDLMIITGNSSIRYGHRGRSPDMITGVIKVPLRLALFGWDLETKTRT
jgi:hypothetical protein